MNTLYAVLRTAALIYLAGCALACVAVGNVPAAGVCLLLLWSI